MVSSGSFGAGYNHSKRRLSETRLRQLLSTGSLACLQSGCSKQKVQPLAVELVIRSKFFKDITKCFFFFSQFSTSLHYLFWGGGRYSVRLPCFSLLMLCVGGGFIDCWWKEASGITESCHPATPATTRWSSLRRRSPPRRRCRLGTDLNLYREVENSLRETGPGYCFLVFICFVVLGGCF